MRVIKFGFYSVVSLWMSQALAQESLVLTSQNLAEVLKAKSTRVESARLDVEASKERDGHLGRSFLPSLELHGAQESFKIGRQENKSQPAYGVEAKVNLFNGGRDRLTSEVQSLETQKRTWVQQQETAGELGSAREQYWNLRFLQEKVLVLESAIEMNRQNLSAAQKRIQSGVAAESDRVEFEMKAVDLKRQLAEAQLQVKSQTRELLLTLGLDLQTDLKTPEKMEHFHQEPLVPEHAEKDHEFLYKAQMIDSEQKSLGAKTLGRSWWPRVDAYAGYNQYNEREKEFAASGDRTESVLGLRMTLGFASGFSDQREAAALRKEAQASDLKAALMKKQVELSLERDKEALQLMHDQVHDAEANIARAERYYQITQSEYRRGVKNSPDVLGASEKLFDMKEQRLRIIRDFYTAQGYLLAKSGL